jgi:hypothetical protein
MLQNRRIVWPSYLIAFSLCVIPPIDALMQTMPMRFGDTRWRWGVFGLMSNAMMVPMIGLLIAFVVSSAFEHRRFQRVLGVLTALVAVGALVGLGSFALDTVQLHRDLKPGFATAFNIAFLTATTKSTVGMLTLAAFTWTAFSGPKAKTQAAKKNSIIIGGARQTKAGPTPASTPAVEPAVVESN